MKLALDLSLETAALFGGASGYSGVPVSLGALAWYDPSDLSTMFQDSAGTTPVTADGDPVGLILDKSGNGLDLSQGTAAARPLYKTAGGLHWLQLDGVDDKLSVNDALLRILGDLTLCAGAYKDAGGSYGGILSCQTGAGTVNAYEWRFTNAAADLQQEFVAADGASAESDAIPTGFGAFATTYVASLRRDVGATVEMSLNASRQSLTHTMVPTADASSAFVMGDRNAGGIPLAGRIYQAVVFNSRLSDPDLATLETFVGDKCGIVL